MHEELIKSIKSKTSNFLKGLESEIVDINIKVVRKETMIDILADRLKGGITIDECSIINKYILQIIEDEQLAEEPYSVNVSSPGIDRPLVNKKDFLRVTGRDVAFYLAKDIGGKKEYIGKIEEVTKNEVIINVKDILTAVPFKDIDKAVQVI